ARPSDRKASPGPGGWPISEPAEGAHEESPTPDDSGCHPGLQGTCSRCDPSATPPSAQPRREVPERAKRAAPQGRQEAIRPARANWPIRAIENEAARAYVGATPQTRAR